MKEVVRKFFIKFSEPFEGIVPHMYQDNKGLVTVGMGNLIEPIQLGFGMPWRRADGSKATQSEYISEWNVINSKEDLARAGWTAATPWCKLHISPDDIANLVYSKMYQNESVLRKRLSDRVYDGLCADAQLFLHSWAWAVGPAGNYPRMLRNLNNGNFQGALMECDINPKVGTIILRNNANHQLLLNAQRIAELKMDPEELYYPRIPGKTDGGEDDFDHSTVSLQHALALLGWNIVQDGIWGPKTDEALRKFQLSRRLKVDGIAGPLTWAAIHTALRFR